MSLIRNDFLISSVLYKILNPLEKIYGWVYHISYIFIYSYLQIYNNITTDYTKLAVANIFKT